MTSDIIIVYQSRCFIPKAEKLGKNLDFFVPKKSSFRNLIIPHIHVSIISLMSKFEQK